MTRAATISALAIAALMMAVWLISLPKRDASIVDIAWGPGFAVVAWSVLITTDAAGFRGILVTVLLTLWAVRLGLHLAVRNLPHGEDPRYVAMRRRWGPAFPFISLGTVYLFQGVMMWVVSLPAQVAIGVPGPAGVQGWDVAGVGLWLTGFLFEAVGDEQLRRFKADPAGQGKVMDLGLWRYTRHPNYFGNACMWWGIGLVSVSTPGRLWALVGPAVMTVLLVRVSGVALLERRLKRRKPDYDDYVARTSAFIPLPPRAAR